MGKKNYVFLDTECHTLDELGIALSENFGYALQDIYDRTKELIGFIRKQNKKIVSKIVSYFTECKYKNSVLTFLIFHLCSDKRVVINGEVYDFKAFVKALKKYGKDHKAIFTFIEDSGISETYATLNIEPTLEQDAYFIEKNINDPFVMEYLTTFYDYDYVESLRSHIANVFIYDEEGFRETLEIVKKDKFGLLLAHKIGFRPVFDMRNTEMPVFKALLLLRQEFDEKDLKRVLDGTFFWWLLENYENYTYKKESKEIRNKLKEIQKKKEKVEKNAGFEEYVHLSSELYDIYIEFIRYVRKGQIGIKKNVDEEQFVLDKAYCNTFICYDYMKDHTVKLSTENIDTESDKETASQQEDTSLNMVLKQEKTIQKWKRYMGMSLFIGILSILSLALYIVLGFVMGKNLFDVYSMVPVFLTLGFSVVYGISLLVYLLKVNKTDRAVGDCILWIHLSDLNLKRSLQQEHEYERISQNIDVIRKRAMVQHRILSCLNCILFCGIPAGSAFYGFGFIRLLISEESFESGNLAKIYWAIGVGFGLLYGLIRKRKGAFTAILLSLVSVAGVIGLAFIMR